MLNLSVRKLLLFLDCLPFQGPQFLPCYGALWNLDLGTTRDG